MLMARLKRIDSMSILIKDISNNIIGRIFHSVFIVTYRTFFDKENKTKSILCVNLTDKKFEMKMALLVPT